MNLVYFTSGEGLQDVEIRRQVLRIPEVLSHLRKFSNEDEGWDYLGSLLLEEEFVKLCPVRRRHLTNLVQQGLFERFNRARQPYEEMIRRVCFTSAEDVLRQFQWYLRTDEALRVFVIGPGLDEVAFHLRNTRAEFIDMIDHDPQLQWFWSEIREHLPKRNAVC